MMDMQLNNNKNLLGIVLSQSYQKENHAGTICLMNRANCSLGTASIEGIKS